VGRRGNTPKVEERAMHLQIRTTPVSSPPDVEKLLRLLAEANVNLGGAGGSNLEFGGEFALAFEDGDETGAIAILEEHHYPFRVLEAGVDPGLTLCYIQNPREPGGLHNCLKGVADANLESGRIIRDILIGVPTDEGLPVQIYSEQVRTPLTVGDESSS
jgi:hypothetical protein